MISASELRKRQDKNLNEKKKLEYQIHVLTEYIGQQLEAMETCAERELEIPRGVLMNYDRAAIDQVKGTLESNGYKVEIMLSRDINVGIQKIKISW